MYRLRPWGVGEMLWGKHRKEMFMTNKIIKIKKGFKKNIIGGLLLGSSIAAITPIQASQRYSRGSNLPPPRREVPENRGRKMIGRTEEEGKKLLEKWANMTPEERAKEKRQEEKKRIDKFWKRIKYLKGKS
jgi:hypothetical protein